MSFLVLAIATGHAIPPIVGAALGKKKPTVFIGAGIACAIAIASGNPAFIVADLIGVGFGAWVGMSIVEKGVNK